MRSSEVVGLKSEDVVVLSSEVLLHILKVLVLLSDTPLLSVALVGVDGLALLGVLLALGEEVSQLGLRAVHILLVQVSQLLVNWGIHYCRSINLLINYNSLSL